MNLSPAKWFSSIIAIIVITNIACLLDIPVLRQISGFVFLTFIPGFLILLVLRLNRLGLLEKVVLSVGLSIAFAMFFGLALNTMLVAVGYTRPLSIISLLISFSVAAIILAVIAFIRNKDSTLSFSDLNLTLREKTFLIVPSLFPLLSIVGTRVMNLTENNVVLMTLLLLIPAFVIFISIYQRKVPQRIYPGLIYLIGISLLLIISLRSNHLIGSDIHEWYYNYQITLDNLHWSILGPGILDACLSISLLPAIYQVFLNINPEFLFKLLYPILFSISPLVVYIISKKYIGSFYAFLASLFFMAQYAFLWTAGISNTNLAILFFGLSLMVLFYDGISEINRRLLFIIFAASCIVSHYSTTYVFLLILLLTWMGMQIIPRILHRERKPDNTSENTAAINVPSNSSSGDAKLVNDVDTSQSTGFGYNRSQMKKKITFTVVALFFVLLFFWYSQITAGAFNVGLAFIRKTLASLSQWFLLESRGSSVTSAMGENVTTIPQQIRLVVSWLTVAFIATGVLSTLARYKKMVAIPNQGRIKPDFLNVKFETEFLVLALACGAALVFSIVLPYVSVGYSTERIYFQTLIVLSLFFVVGGIMVARLIRAKPYWILLLVLIPFFMCLTGTMYQIFGIPASITLNSAGREYSLLYIKDTESNTIQWLNEYGTAGTAIYSEREMGPRIFLSQGNIPLQWFKGPFISKHEAGNDITGYIYLSEADVINGDLVMQYPDIFAGKNKIYTTSCSEIYR